MPVPSISPAPIISRSFNGSTRTINLQLAVSQRSDARLISRWYAAQFSCSLPATTRLLLPNSCWPPDILLAVRSVKSARRSWLARISGCSWEQPPSYILGPRSRAGSRHPEWLCRTSRHSRSRTNQRPPLSHGGASCKQTSGEFPRARGAFHERADALFDAGDSFFSSRRVQFAVLPVRHAIPA